MTTATADFLSVTQEKFDRHMKRSLELAFEDGKTKDEVAQIKREWKGGKCPLCGTEYAPKRIKKEKHGTDYQFFVPACNCTTSLEEQTEERRIDSKMQMAGVPPIYRNAKLEDWDREVEPETNESFDKVQEYITGRVYHKGRGNILFGQVGTGKTRTAVCILRAMAIEGMSVKFSSMGDALELLMDRRFPKFDIMNRFLDFDAVLFDDLDKVAAEQDYIQEKIFRIFDKMISNRKTILGTTNFRGPSDFKEKFDEAIFSRLMKGCLFTKFVGVDYRLKERKRK